MKFKHTDEVYAANEPIFLGSNNSYGTQKVGGPQFLMAYILTSGPVLYLIRGQATLG